MSTSVVVRLLGCNKQSGASRIALCSAYLVPTPTLGGIERLIHFIEEAGRCQCAFSQGGNADADGDDTMLPGSCCDSFAEALGDPDSLDCTGVGKDGEEFLTAIAGDQVAFPCAFLDKGRDSAQCLVPLHMSKGVVKVLEVVDIEHQEAELPPGAYATRKLPFQEIFQGSTVHKAGQRIGKRESAQSFIQNLR